jgi:hypothetical protein
VIRVSENGRYIGAPNGIVLCVNGRGQSGIEGELYHGYSKEGILFKGYEDIIKIAEKLFDALGFPYRGTGDRDINGRIHSYYKEEGMARVLKDEEMLERHGDMGTFVIRVQHRQHSSWQGRVTYLEEDKSAYFRSVLELIKIIDGALDEAEQSPEPEDHEEK